MGLDPKGDEAEEATVMVIGAGFGRTGTMSLQTALDLLFAPKKCYHFGSILQQKHMHLWQDALASRLVGSPDWVQILEKNGFVATMDHPCCEYTFDLLQKYPNAKVILSEHPGGPEKWYESKQAHESITTAAASWPIKPLVDYVMPLMTRLIFRNKGTYKWSELKQFANLVEHNAWGDRGVLDRDNAMQKYESWYSKVKESVPADRLLVFSVKQGWGPLCEFLGKPIPEDPFPKDATNNTKSIKKQIFRAQLALWMIYAGVLTGAVCTVRRFSRKP